MNRSGYSSPLAATYEPESPHAASMGALDGRRGSFRRMQSEGTAQASPKLRRSVNLAATAAPVLVRAKAASLDSPKLRRSPKGEDLLLESYTSAQFKSNLEKDKPATRTKSTSSSKSDDNPLQSPQNTNHIPKKLTKKKACLCKACTLRRQSDVPPLPNVPDSPPQTTTCQMKKRGEASPERQKTKTTPKKKRAVNVGDKVSATPAKTATKAPVSQQTPSPSKGKPLKAPGKAQTRKLQASKSMEGSQLTRQGSIRRPKKAARRPSADDLQREKPLDSTSSRLRLLPSHFASAPTTPKMERKSPPLVALEVSPRELADFECRVGSPGGHRRLASSSSLESFLFLEDVPADPRPTTSPKSRRGSLFTTCMSSFNFERVPTPAAPPVPVDTLTEEGLHGLFDTAVESLGEGERTLTEVLLSSRSEAVESVNTNGSSDSIRWKRGPLLGRGAFGSVWLALTLGGELLAVKEASIRAVDMARAQREFEKIQEEVSLLKSLRHPNIVSYLGTCLSDNVVWIFMEYVPGGSLASLLHRFGPLDQSVICTYTPQILSALAYIHGKGILHRDIKGSNIMLMPSGVIKLIDFGCAKRVLNAHSKVMVESTEDLRLSMKGTPFWIAPEVINEAPQQGTKSDIWSLGCTVVEMALGKPPWAELGKYAALRVIAGGTCGIPSLPCGFGAAAEDFVGRCLVRDPVARASAAELLRHPFLRGAESPEAALARLHDPGSGKLRRKARKPTL